RGVPETSGVLSGSPAFSRFSPPCQLPLGDPGAGQDLYANDGVQVLRQIRTVRQSSVTAGFRLRWTGAGGSPRLRARRTGRVWLGVLRAMVDLRDLTRERQFLRREGGLEAGELVVELSLMFLELLQEMVGVMVDLDQPLGKARLAGPEGGVDLGEFIAHLAMEFLDLIQHRVELGLSLREDVHELADLCP